MVLTEPIVARRRPELSEESSMWTTAGSRTDYRAPKASLLEYVIWPCSASRGAVFDACAPRTWESVACSLTCSSPVVGLDPTLRLLSM